MRGEPEVRKHKLSSTLRELTQTSPDGGDAEQGRWGRKLPGQEVGQAGPNVHESPAHHNRAMSCSQREGQGRDPASQQGSKLITDICQRGHCPWCCHTAGCGIGASQPQIPVSQSHGQPAPSPAPPSSRPFPARSRPIGPTPGSGLGVSREGPCPRPFSQQSPHSQISAQLSPRWAERQNCFPNWYFPVDRTFYAFFHLYHLITKCFHF